MDDTTSSERNYQRQEVSDDGDTPFSAPRPFNNYNPTPLFQCAQYGAEMLSRATAVAHAINLLISGAPDGGRCFLEICFSNAINTRR
jgi:hypothetical protein